MTPDKDKYDTPSAEPSSPEDDGRGLEVLGGMMMVTAGLFTAPESAGAGLYLVALGADQIRAALSSDNQTSGYKLGKALGLSDGGARALDFGLSMAAPGGGTPKAAANGLRAGKAARATGEAIEAGAKLETGALKAGAARLAPKTTTPQKALDTLDTIKKTGAAPKGYKGGGQFMNDGRGGGQVLPSAVYIRIAYDREFRCRRRLRPLTVLERSRETELPPTVSHRAGRSSVNRARTTRDGKPITYREWDVDPKVPGVPRNADRIVTGSDGKVYYTNDHYTTFTEIK
jgi:hypothetical protein